MDDSGTESDDENENDEKDDLDDDIESEDGDISKSNIHFKIVYQVGFWECPLKNVQGDKKYSIYFNGW